MFHYPQSTQRAYQVDFDNSFPFTWNLTNTRRGLSYIFKGIDIHPCT